MAVQETKRAGLDETILRELRRPFEPAAIDFKIQASPKQREQGWSMAQIVAFHDARLVTERLNHVVGGAWSDSYAQVPGGMMCALTVLGVTRRDVGWSKGTGSSIDLKTLYSDAFKRAGVKFGIAVSVYALPKLYVKAEKLTQLGQGKDAKWFMSDQLKDELRKSYYETWLERAGKTAFGEPLGHGDSLNAQGDPDLQGDDHEPGESPDPLEKLVAYADFIRQAVRVYDKNSFPDDPYLRLRDEAKGTGEEALRAFVGGMLKELTEKGGDPDAVNARWQERQS